MEDAVLNGRPKRPKQLLKIWQAIGDNDPSAFRKALTTSITDFSKQERNPAFCTNARNALAVEESVMCLAAKRLGIDTPKLDESVSDYLVTTDSIRYCDHD
jgi:hypothetical protein